MAQVSYTPIQLYYSSTASAQPLAANLAYGELALNAADGKLYYKESPTGTVKLLANTSTVASFSAGTTGFTPSTATTGAITLAGTLNVGSGGTGITSLTSNYIPYGNGSSAFQSSTNLQFNGTTLAITGAVTATADSAFTSTGALQIPSGTTGQQPTGVAGKIRFNTTTVQFEGYNGTAWSTIGGGAAITNDTATASYEYPLFAAVTTGIPTTIYTSNSKYLYKPSTGDLQSTSFTASGCFFLNPQTLPASYTVPASYSASSVGPITIPSGMSVTVSTGARWVVL